MLQSFFRTLTRKQLLDIIYTLSHVGFNISDQTESQDLLYWYGAYKKDLEKAKSEQSNTAQKMVRR